jgi:K+/H+ antiporter YhaU regulatory subunit KhtT
MIKENPEDSVREEQNGAEMNAAGTEDENKTKMAEENEASADSENRKHTSPTAEFHEIEEIELPPVDYSGFSKNELVETLGLIIENRPPSEIREDVERIKTLFYKKLKHETEERKAKFLEGGGKIEEYKIWVDPLDYRVKELLDKYREKKNDYTKVQEAEKYENLKRKYDIIDKIKDLVNREESINKTFHDFRTLQNDWHTIGVVPQASLKDLWENYHHSVEVFYDYIKINKELRDLDLRKNLEAKVILCEKAEELLLEPNPVNAFRSLQDFHNQWREIGPVPQESKNEIWERFKEATSQINKRHHEYFEKQKDDQRKNLDAKLALCEEVEAINLMEIKNFRDFDERADKIVSLQKMWRTIGFAPKKQNNKVYQRFREACDTFFEKKRTFYADNKETQLNNLQLKTELCIQAESLQESTDWKSTSDALIKLQREWKEIGPVPRKQSEKTWKRFRKACDQFFNRKAEFFANLDTSYEDNLKAKIAVIEELEKFEPGTDVQAAFERLKDLQRKWTEIGFVPFNKKEEITNRYRNALNKEFDKLKIADEDKSILKYRTKLDNLKTNPKASRKVRNERDKFFTKIKQLESDIVLWENNIGFFAKSTNADTMIREVQEKIESAKKMIKTLEEKVRMIDQSGLDD